MDKRHMDSTKAIYHMDRIIDHFDKGERIAPVHIDMGIAKFCNVACVFCYGFYQNPSKEHIQREALLQTMRDAGEIGVRSVGFIGDGEPLCNPHVYTGLREGKKAGLDMALSTNGVTLDAHEKRDVVLDSCTWMRFCLSAGTKEGYKQIHQRDYFDKVRKNIEMIVRQRDAENHNCDVGIQAVFVPTLMAEEMVEEAKRAVDLGVDYFVIKQCSLPDEGQSGMMQFNLDDYDKPEVVDKLKEAESLSTDRTKVIVKWNIMAQKGEKPYQGCPSIPLIWEMSGNGDCFPCGYMFGDKPQFEKYKFGNVHETRLKDMWESDRYWDIIRQMREDFDVQTQCRGCCRQDSVNKFVYDYLQTPQGRNFI